MIGLITSWAGEVVIFTSASEVFSQRNISRSTAESVECFREVALAAKDNCIRLFGCNAILTLQRTATKAAKIIR